MSDHEHVSEREAGPWWSCVWCSGVMLARAGHRSDIPATLTEALHLCAAGHGSAGGAATAEQLQAGLKDRYNMDTRVVGSFDALWQVLVPGTAAAAMGSMGAFSVGHPLRRWDPAFHGTHDVFIARLDDKDRVWWDDPLAPIILRGKGGTTLRYTGQWVAKADLSRFVRAYGSARHVVALSAITSGTETPMTAATITSEVPATMHVAARTHWLDLDGKTVLATAANDMTGRYSPFEAGKLRAMYVTLDKVRRTVLVVPVPGSVKPIPAPVAVPDPAKIEAAHSAGVTDEKKRVRDILGL